MAATKAPRHEAIPQAKPYGMTDGSLGSFGIKKKLATNAQSDPSGKAFRDDRRIPRFLRDDKKNSQFKKKLATKAL